MKHVTLNDIARRLGISKMTVSRALRGEEHVAVGTKEKVVRTALEIGYRPDPEIAKLMTHMRQSKTRRAPPTLAFVWAENDPAPTPASWQQKLLRGARKQAERLGFELQEFHLQGRGMTGRRLSSILEARGISGLILSPLVSRTRGHVTIAWEKFACVVIGLGFARPALHRVHHHHYLGMMTTLRMLRKKGFRRIGFYCGSTINERMFRAWSSSFLAHHPLAKVAGLLALRKTPSKVDFLEWIEKANPEVVIDGGHIVVEWLKNLPIAKRPPLVTLGWRADYPQVPGIDQQPEVLGAAAVDLLVAQYQQNEKGIPKAPRIVMTEGFWRPSTLSK